MSVLGRSLEEVDARVHELLERFSSAIRDSQFVFHKRTTYFHEKLFGTSFHERKRVEYGLDETDKRILAALSTDSRVDAASLAMKLSLSGVAIGQRIRKLEQSGIIRRYGLFLDTAKLGYTQYSVFMKNNHVADRSKLIAALEAHPAVHMLFEYVGDQFLEFGVCVKDQHDLRAVLSEIESAFPENRVLSVHVLQGDVLSVAPPAIIFEEGIKTTRKS